MANVLGIIRNKASGIAGAVELYIDGVKKTEYKKVELNEIESEFESASTLPYSFYQGSVVVLNDEIHILGGNGDNTKHYKWNGNTWTNVSTLPYSFYQGSAVVLNDEIHILGGNGSGNNTRHYKWNGNTWTSVSTLPYSFYQGSAVVLNDEIHILGGKGSENSTRHYKWNGNTWTSVSTLPFYFYSLYSTNFFIGAVVLNDEIHILDASNKKHYKWNGNTWTSVSTLPNSDSRSCIGLYKNNLCIVEQYDTNGGFKLYLYKENEWIKVHQQNSPRFYYKWYAETKEGINVVGGSYSPYQQHVLYKTIYTAKLT